MARYFMHLRSSTSELLDHEGLELPTVEALRRAVLLAARDLMSGDVRDGRLDMRFRIDAQDETGAIVYSLPFTQALNVITEPKGSPRLFAV